MPDGGKIVVLRGIPTSIDNERVEGFEAAIEGSGMEGNENVGRLRAATSVFLLKGDEWQQVPFSFEVLKKDAATERVYIDERTAP